MERKLGQVDMVRWQGRREQPAARARGRTARIILAMGVLALFSLMVGFYSGLPVPVVVLQDATTALIAFVAALGIWVLVASPRR